MKIKNTCELEIALFCKGLRVAERCKLDPNARGFIRTRAGLGSGLEIVLNGKSKNIFMNVPINERFVDRSPFMLVNNGGAYSIRDEETLIEYPITVLKAPDWYNKKTSYGNLMSRIAVMQGTHLAVYIGDVCSFWNQSPPKRCKFCTTGLNVGTTEEEKKPVQEVVETALAAKAENKITFIHFNSGYQKNSGIELVAPYVRAIKKDVGALIGVQMTPDPDLWKYDRLIDMGVDHFSFCYELHNPEYFKKYLPGKHEYLTQKKFFNALEHVSKKMKRGSVSGEIIAGIEPIEDTFKAIDYITGIGAFPTICIFRPLAGADLEEFKSPRFEEMREIHQYMIQALQKNNVPIGLAPNLEVSLVVLPTEAIELVSKNVSNKRYFLKNNLLKMLTYPYFKYRMRRYDPGGFGPNIS